MSSLGIRIASGYEWITMVLYISQGMDTNNAPLIARSGTMYVLLFSRSHLMVTSVAITRPGIKHKAAALVSKLSPIRIPEKNPIKGRCVRIAVYNNKLPLSKYKAAGICPRHVVQ